MPVGCGLLMLVQCRLCVLLALLTHPPLHMGIFYSAVLRAACALHWAPGDHLQTSHH